MFVCFRKAAWKPFDRKHSGGRLLRIRQWNSCKYMCPWCHAHRDGPNSWHNFALNAPWFTTCRTHAQFVADLNASAAQGWRKDVAPFAFCPKITQAPFFSWTMVVLDWMHDVDLGIVAYELGEVLWSILPQLGDAAASSDKARRSSGLRALKDRLKEFYEANGTESRIPVKRLTLRKIKSKKFPKLKAKAAQASRLVPFCLELAAEFRGHDGDLGENRYRSMELLRDLCRLGSRRSLTAQDLAEWRAKAAFHMFYYAACGFRVYPKHHYFLHFPMIIERSGVPRGFWVYSDESKNRQIKLLFQVCSKGHSVEQQMLLRLEWQRALADLRLRERMGH